jgi:Ser/Thr protein kinase RdoA (MazF antagonist)
MSGAAPPELARAALARWELPSAAELRFLRHGENTTYRVSTREGDLALRLARPGYQTAAAIHSEIAWMAALRAAGITTPAPVRGRNGEAVQEIQLADGQVQLAVAFAWVDGVPLPEVVGLDPWQRLGEMMARIHRHGQSWEPPDGFERPAWDLEALVGDAPRWGTPCPDGVWSNEDRSAILAAREAVRERLQRFGTAAERYGLIHADLGFENVLVQRDGAAVVIDFDDSGPSWFLYELASALYPLEASARFATCRDALVAGYRRLRPVPDEELQELETFLMCRRLATLGWTFSRAETSHAQRQRRRRLRSSGAAARRFLEWHAQRAARPALA